MQESTSRIWADDSGGCSLTNAFDIVRKLVIKGKHAPIYLKHGKNENNFRFYNIWENNCL